MKDLEISITGIGSVSALGHGSDLGWPAYRDPGHCLEQADFGGQTAWCGRVPETSGTELDRVANSHPAYEGLDRSVLLAIFASRLAVQRAGWGNSEAFGVNIGSSRGATGLLEKYLETYTQTGRVPALASPATTLGNIASWVAQDLRAGGPELSHSITCSTALHAILNGVAWLRSGMSGRFLCGGSEAPLTGFTLAQMRALKIYSRETGSYPCRALDPEKPNSSMVLGEGAGSVCLETGRPDTTLAVIRGVGYATEPLEHPVSLSADAVSLQDSMRRALGTTDPGEVDAVVLHAPGTRKGDLSELQAVQAVFGGKPPALTSNKWKIGHTFGASGILSLELAVGMLNRQEFIGVPYLTDSRKPGELRNVLVNAVGFGANAVSLLISRP